jgi:hypothetical protein
MEKLIASKNRRQDRLNYVKYWAEYIKTHSDEEWSRQQNILINSIIPDPELKT